MKDERNLIVDVLRHGAPMTASEIATVICRRGPRKVGRRRVEQILKHNSLVFDLHSNRRFLKAARWRLAEVGPTHGPDAAGAPVPAWPHPPTLSGAAAAVLTFREDQPPTSAIGKPA